MPESFDFTRYAQQVRRTATSLLGSVHTVANIAGSMHLLNVAAERDLALFGEPLGASRVVCGPGCGACCVLNVAVLFPEAVAITWYLQRSLSAGELETTTGCLKELYKKTCWLDDEERLFLREPCAFLDASGSCMIHCVRPLLCRAVTSTDAQACRDGIAMVPLLGSPSVEMNLFQKSLIDTVYSGLGAALQDLGLDHRPQRLCRAVLTLLADPDAVNRFASKPIAIQ